MNVASDSTWDPSDMLGAVAGLPEQIEAAWGRVAALELPRHYREIDKIVLLGMGGSAIGGDLAAATMAETLRVPMIIVRDYESPPWVDDRTLCIACSFSGNTEETLSAFEGALAAGAALVAITSGGELGGRADSLGLPIVDIPPGGQPRAAVGWSLTSILGVLHGARMIASPESELAAATIGMRALLEVAGPDVNGGGAPGELAERLRGHMTMIYASERLAPVARRWKTQLNENAKTTALWDTLPELNHNTVVGYSALAEGEGSAIAVSLEAPGGNPRLNERLEATKELLGEHSIPWAAVDAPPGTLLAQALWLIQYGDLASVYLARIQGVDPTPVVAIDRLKARLASSRQ